MCESELVCRIELSMTSAQDREFYSDVSLSADVVESTLLEILPEGL